jgi:hypothetical protein
MCRATGAMTREIGETTVWIAGGQAIGIVGGNQTNY